MNLKVFEIFALHIIQSGQVQIRLIAIQFRELFLSVCLLIQLFERNLRESLRLNRVCGRSANLTASEELAAIIRRLAESHIREGTTSLHHIHGFLKGYDSISWQYLILFRFRRALVHRIAQFILVTGLEATSSLALLRLFELCPRLISLKFFEKFRITLLYELHFFLGAYL